MRRRSAAFELTALTVLVMAVLLAASSWLMLRWHRSWLVDEARRGLLLTSDTLEASLRYAMMRNHREEIRASIDQITRQTQVRRVRITDHRGRITVSTNARDEGRRLGAFEYVTKPFTRQELCSVVVRALRAPQAAGGASAPVPASAVGKIAAIEFPAAGDILEQGRVCALIRAADGVEHSVYCPLSGRVMESNRAVVDDPRLVNSSPEAEGWLVRLAPLRAEEEVANLVRG